MNTWWKGRLLERFWLAVDSAADELRAPKPSPTAKGIPVQTLLQHVEPDDVVFHYSSSSQAITGWSIAAKEPEETEPLDNEQTRKRAKKSKGIPRDIRVALKDRKPIEPRFTLKQLRIHAAGFDALRRSLESAFPQPLYLPFDQTKSGALRIAEGELFKLPEAALRILLDTNYQPAFLTDPSDPSPATSTTSNKKAPDLGDFLERKHFAGLALRTHLESFFEQRRRAAEAIDFLHDLEGTAEALHRAKGCCELCGARAKSLHPNLGEAALELHRYPHREGDQRPSDRNADVINQPKLPNHTNDRPAPDPSDETIVLCANCHRILHAKTPPLHPEDARPYITTQRKAA